MAESTLGGSSGAEDFIGRGEGPRSVDADRMLASLQGKLFGKEAETKIGRFVLQDRVGSGGMGIVFAARDPELERRVALKILRSVGDDGERQRLLREARSMARLRHPNLVTVFEVGTHETEVFVAMEYVDGGSVKSWMHDARTWREVAGVFLGAAEGLAAIHDAGLVHRDFKPDNVLLGANGRAQVADFGLAKPLDEAARKPEHELVATDAGHTPVELATQTGAFVGTPAYMAPEQWTDGGADARSDQFSFCVALWEALYGQRPFSGTTIHALIQASASFDRAPPASGPGGSIPAWLRRVVERGLAPTPDDRFSSMRELISALQAGRGRSRRWMIAGAAVGGSIAGALVFALATPEDKPCEFVADAIDGDWSPQRGAAIAEAFAGVDVEAAREAWARVEPRLDAYARAWKAAKRDACEATRVRHEQSEAAFDLRMRCLDRRRSELAALLDLYERVDRDLVARAAQAADGLTGLAACEDVELLALEAPLPEDPQRRTAIFAIRKTMFELKALADAGRFAEGSTRAAEMFESLAELNYKPAKAEAHYYRGMFELQLGKVDEGIADLEEAFHLAMASGHPEVQAQSALVLVHAHGVRRGDVKGARRWGKLATSALEGWAPRVEVRATLESNLGAAETRVDPEASRPHFERALELYEEAGLGQSVSAAQTMLNLGGHARRRGDLKEAAAQYEAAGRILDAQLGPNHVSVGRFHNSLGSLYLTQGKLDAAEVEFRRAFEVMSMWLPATHSSLGHPRNNLGEIAAARGDHAAAIEDFDKALAIWEATHGRAHPLVAHVLTERGLSHLAAGDREAALEDLEAAFAVRSKGPASADLARTSFGLARAVDDDARATTLGQQALDALPPAAAQRDEIQRWLGDR